MESGVKERPVIFKTHEVLAVLADRKTQFRRPVKPQPKNRPAWSCPDEDGWEFPFATYAESFLKDARPSELVNACPYGRPGDRLWVRETFWCENETCDHEYCHGCDMGSLLSLGEEYAGIDYYATPTCFDPPKLEADQSVSYHSGPVEPGDAWWLGPPNDWDGDTDYWNQGEWIFLPWTYYTKYPSIHMPRWASRFTFEVTDVHVERIQNISPDDARAEGLQCLTKDGGHTYKYGIPEADGLPGDTAWHWSEWDVDPVAAFRKLWDSFNGKHAGLSWDDNPWVFAVDFRCVNND